MAAMLDAFLRSVAYCLHPRVIALSVLPLLLIGAMMLGFSHFYWDDAVGAVRTWLESIAALERLWDWLRARGMAGAEMHVAPLIVVLTVMPLIVVASLMAVAVMMTPALVTLVAQRRFPALERKNGGSFVLSLAWSLGSAALALVVLVLSMPLWLIPPLVLILPPLIWGWLTYRVMAFDALAEHASRLERQEIFRRHRIHLLGLGVLSGYLGAAPAILWASGILFVAAFFVMIPLAIWLYTLVFAFSSLWFTHYCLAALERLRAESTMERSPGVAVTAASPAVVAELPFKPEHGET